MSPCAELVGLVPAAGHATRLGVAFPKELFPILPHRYVPLGEVTLQNLRAAGARHVVVVIQAHKAALLQCFGSGRRLGLDISYVCQDDYSNNARKSGGLSEALDSGYHLVRGRTVLFGMPDTLVWPPDCFRQILAEMEASGADLVLGLFPTDTPEKFGMVEFSEDGSVVQIIDKPETTDLTHMWGIIAWSGAFTEHLHRCVEDGIPDFAEIMNLGIDCGLVARSRIIQGGLYADLARYDDVEPLLDMAARTLMASERSGAALRPAETVARRGPGGRQSVTRSSPLQGCS